MTLAILLLAGMVGALAWCVYSLNERVWKLENPNRIED